MTPIATVALVNPSGAPHSRSFRTPRILMVRFIGAAQFSSSYTAAAMRIAARTVGHWPPSTFARNKRQRSSTGAGSD
jgi:hypothetical protein